MVVASCRLQLFIMEADSLKEKRSCLKSLMQRLKNRFNISIAEVGSQDLYRRGELGVAVVSNEKKHLEVMLQNIIRFIELDGRLEILKVSTEYI